MQDFITALHDISPIPADRLQHQWVDRHTNAWLPSVSEPLDKSEVKVTCIRGLGIGVDTDGRLWKIADKSNFSAFGETKVNPKGAPSRIILYKYCK